VHISDDHPFDIQRNTHYHRVCPVDNANVTFNLLSNELVVSCYSIFTFICMFCIVCPSIYGFWLSSWYLETRLTTNKTFHRQYECQMTSVHYFDISLKKIPSYVQLKFNIKSNIHTIITTFSTNALDTRLQVTFAFSIGHTLW
jgi:hypothetical protein